VSPPNSFSAAFPARYDAAFNHGLTDSPSVALTAASARIRSRTSTNSTVRALTRVVVVVVDVVVVTLTTGFMSGSGMGVSADDDATSCNVLDVLSDTTTCFSGAEPSVVEGFGDILDAGRAAVESFDLFHSPSSINVSSIPDTNALDPSSKSMTTMAPPPHAPKQGASSMG
jgi:hypothetical protein